MAASPGIFILPICSLRG